MATRAHKKVSGPSALHLATWGSRLRQVAMTLGLPPAPAGVRPMSARTLKHELERVVDVTDRGQMWLVLTALSG